MMYLWKGNILRSNTSTRHTTNASTPLTRQSTTTGAVPNQDSVIGHTTCRKTSI